MADDNNIVITRKDALKILWGGVPPSFIAPALLIFALTIAFIVVTERGYSAMNKSIAARQLARDNLEVVNSLESLLVNAETGQRGYLLTGNEDYLTPLIEARDALPQVQQKMAITFANRPDRQPFVEKLAKLSLDKFIEMDMTVALAKQGKREEAIQIVMQNVGREQMVETRKQLAVMAEKMDDELAAARLRTQQDMSLSRFGALSMALLNILLLGYALYLFMRDLKQRQALIEIRENENQRLQSQVDERTSELNELSSHLLESTEKDRAALARDLHDELGGILTAVKMDLDWLQTHSTQTPQSAKRFAQISTMIDEGVAIKRRVIENLRPSLLDNLGLSAALEWYINEHCTKGGMSCKLNLAEELGVISPDAAIALFRIVQEGTTNTLRHANAKNFTADLHVDDTHIHLKLTDDGHGLPQTFNPAKLSHGLSGMRQRARSLGGDAIWRSSPGSGTTIEVIIPREVAK
jgi:signal transduction histidine kinase